MSFDARSRERLEALGRSLPQKLPLPSSPASPAPSPAGRKSDTAPRHRVEIEENPEDLFRALMEASADGSVPSHLLDRLRELEAAKPGRRSGVDATLNSNPGAHPPATGAERGGPSPSSPPRRPASNRPPSRPPRRASGPERDLYDAFDNLLHLEHDDQPDAPAQSGRAINELLLPKPTLRQARPGSVRA